MRDHGPRLSPSTNKRLPLVTLLRFLRALALGSSANWTRALAAEATNRGLDARATIAGRCMAI